MSTHDNNNKKWKNLVLAGGGYKGVYIEVFFMHYKIREFYQM